MFRTALISMFLTSTALADTWTVGDDGKIALDTYLEVEDPHTYIFKNRQSLEYDLTRIAIQLKTADDLFWSKVNVPLGSVEPSPIKDWYLLTLSNRSHTIDGVVQATTKYAALDGVCMASPVFVDGFGGPLIPTSVILMQFNHDPSIKQVNVLLEELNAMPVTEQAWSLLPGSYKVTSCSKNGFDVIAQANALSNRSDVRFAEPDMIFTGVGGGTPNDPGFGNCWGLNNTGQSGGVVDMDMDSLESWDITTGDESILVMIIDTGVQQDHPDINQIGGMDFTSDSSTNGDPVNECDNHGTLVAGCVSAIINNNLGTVGSAPNVNSVSARCYISTDCSGWWIAEYSWTADALDWGLTIGVRVTNNSNKFGGSSAAVESMYEATRDAGMVHFAAAGNDASPTIIYPARLTTVNAVAALDRYGQLASFSNWGNGLAISAPGDSIYTTDRTGADGRDPGDYVLGSGTSYASPYTAGVAALVLSVDQSLTAIEVENILFSSAMDLGDPGYDTTYGHGFVNANNALSLDSNGACCVEIWCTQETLSGCMAIGGNYLGTGTSCSTTSCDTDGVLHVPSEYPDIQTAIIVAVDGNEILIGPGTYTGTGDEVINVMGKRLWIHSSDGPEVTIIDGEGVRRVVQCSSGETNKTIIEGLTLTSGYTTDENNGAGMYCNGGAPTVINCIFDGNTAADGGDGGGLWCGYNSPSFLDCRFLNNTANFGGGMYCWSSNPTITNCIFTNNTADYGGGIRCKEFSNPTLENCEFEGNTANAAGGGMHSFESSGTLENCTFTDNISIGDGAGAYFLFSDSVLTNCVFDSNSSTDEAGGLFSEQSDLVMNYCTFTNNTGDYGGGLYCWGSNPAITNCVFTDNSANYGGGIRCYGDSSPTITDCTLMSNTANYDGGGMYNTSDSIPALVYTLVCANNPNQIVGPWTDGGGNTIADECPECPDINGDGTVDVSDLLIVIGYWGATGSPADLNSDGIVDVSDLLTVIANWGPCP